MEKELEDAIEVARKECKDSHAQACLRTIDQSIAEYGDKGLKVELRYCLSKMGYWRGESAKRVKSIFKKYAKD